MLSIELVPLPLRRRVSWQPKGSRSSGYVMSMPWILRLLSGSVEIAPKQLVRETCSAWTAPPFIPESSAKAASICFISLFISGLRCLCRGKLKSKLNPWASQHGQQIAYDLTSLLLQNRKQIRSVLDASCSKQKTDREICFGRTIPVFYSRKYNDQSQGPKADVRPRLLVTSG